MDLTEQIDDAIDVCGQPGDETADFRRAANARLVEASHVNHDAITQALAGSGSYDALGEREQAAVREAWRERMGSLREGLNYEAEFAAAGESYSAADEDGNVVIQGLPRQLF